MSLIGLPLGVLGIILGCIGVALAVLRRGSGIGFPVAGLAISLLASVVIVTINYAVGKAITESAATKPAVQSKVAADVAKQELLPEVVVNQGDQLRPPAAASKPQKQFGELGGVRAEKQEEQEQWFDATRPIQFGDIRVQVISASIGKIDLKDMFGDAAESRNELLAIVLEVTNLNPQRKIDYYTWRGRDFAFDRDFGTLRDNFGNNYKRIDFGYGTFPTNSVKEFESIYPLRSIRDVLIFQPPISNIEYLDLELPAENVGTTGMIRLRIPKTMISH